ncbi:hypothetical protein PMAYCL1PPCAC_04909, partial [Pristionchus mayeri]
MSAIFISREKEKKIFLYLTLTFCCSMIFHSIAFFLLITRTPKNQIVVRNYLIAIQIVIAVNDVHLDVGLHGIPLFPAIAGYGNGILLRLGVSVKTGLVIIFIISTHVGVTTILCIAHRHQTILPTGNHFKFKKV